MSDKNIPMLIAGFLCLNIYGAGLVEPEAELELVQDVDVVVVGGSSGAVAAALTAKAGGASVFLIAQRPFLGEDMAATYRLRLDEDQDTRCELLKSIFSVQASQMKSLPYTYTFNKKPDAIHRDKGGVMLSDGKWNNAPRDSIQFSEDVEIAIQPTTAAKVDAISVMAYARGGATGFNSAGMELYGKNKNDVWQKIARVDDVILTGQQECVEFRVKFTGEYSAFKIKAIKDPEVSRQLLGEVLLFAQDPDDPKRAAAVPSTTPFKIKRSLDQALMEAGITFITGCASSEILLDANNEPSGVIMANRNGRQCVKAKVIIDATERGVVARAAGAQATPFPAGKYNFKRVVVAGESPQAEGMRVKELFGVFDAHVTGIKAPEGMPSLINGRMFECDIEITMKDGSVRSFAEAEQKARDMTFVPTQLDEADQLFFVPPDNVKCEASVDGAWQGVDQLNLNCFKPQGSKNIFVLGAMADISRDAAAELMKPGNLMAVGERIGVAAAGAAQERGVIKGLSSTPGAAIGSQSARVMEVNTGFPPYLCNASGTVKVNGRRLPVLAECDVVVAGAGTGGAPAGISAARHGMKTIVCEYIHKMGGVSTDGLIGKYWYGNRVGFTREIDKGVAEKGAVFVQSKSEWYRSENRAAGAEIWYGTLVTGVVVEGDQLTGVSVVTPHGKRGIIRCRIAIDATGNAVLPAMAGVETQFISRDEIALQGVGQTPKTLGASYTNTDIGFVDDTDAADMFFFALRSRMNMRDGIWDQAQVVNSRERRRLIGAFYMSPLDVANNRTYPDIVVQTRSNFDSHGHTVHEQFFIEDPGHHAMMVNLPLRCMLPKSLNGLLVIGLGISAHRDAMPILRMQPDVQNQGYAAGVVASEAIKAGVDARDVDIKTVQKMLIEQKILPEEVLTMKDSFPLSDALFAEAIKTLPDGYQGLKVILTDYKRSLPMLRRAYDAAGGEAKFVYAHTLAMMGDGVGADLLIEKLTGMEWDKGWDFRGMGQFNRSVSWVDSYIIALGRAKSSKALPVMAALAEQLTEESEFSHYRSLALAYEAINDVSAAPVLAAMLNIPGVKGKNIVMGLDMPVIKNYACKSGDRERSDCLREISCARALYNLGDYRGEGERVLRAYAADPRGAYSKHARMVLGELKE